jgi:two-component system NarL family sensor kinase
MNNTPKTVTTAWEPVDASPPQWTVRTFEERTARIQAALRLGGVVVLGGYLAVASLPRNYWVCVTVFAAYATWSVLLLLGAWWSRYVHRPSGIVLLVDSMVLTSLLALAGALTTPQLGPLVDDAFFFVALLAAFQLRPSTTAVSATIVALAYFATIVSTGQFHWSHALVHALFLATIGAGCAMLSWSHQRQMQLVTTLANHRSRLVAHLMNTEQREREHLATVLHDGVLQSVLAARQDIEEAQAGTDQQSLTRAHATLVEAARQLRAGVAELHPEVLQHAGLVRALEALGQETGRRAGFTLRFDSDEYTRGPHDELLYAAARELLTNTAKHAHARHVVLSLSQNTSLTRLEVVDDGVGITAQAADKAVQEGHIGLASYKIRIETAGGTLTVTPHEPTGTQATITLPRAHSGTGLLVAEPSPPTHHEDLQEGAR